MKNQYNQWYDQIKNNRNSSPIFKKVLYFLSNHNIDEQVNYLLERASKEEVLQELNFSNAGNGEW